MRNKTLINRNTIKRRNIYVEFLKVKMQNL